MKRLILRWGAFLGLAASLTAQLSAPQAGFARFADGSVHAVQGIQANFIVDPRAITPADHVSFSNAGGLTCSQGLIQLVDSAGKLLAQYETADRAPILHIDASLQSAVVWLPSTRLLLTFNGESFSPTPVDDSAFGGSITFVQLAAPIGTAVQASARKASALSIHYCALESAGHICLARPSGTVDQRAASAATAEFFVQQGDSVAEMSVSLPTGRLVKSTLLPGVRGPVYAQQGWFLFQDGGDLIAQRAISAAQRLPLSPQSLPAGDLILESMSDDWLHVASLSTGTDWAVSLQSSKCTASLLPHPIREDAQ